MFEFENNAVALLQFLGNRSATEGNQKEFVRLPMVAVGCLEKMLGNRHEPLLHKGLTTIGCLGFFKIGYKR